MIDRSNRSLHIVEGDSTFSPWMFVQRRMNIVRCNGRKSRAYLDEDKDGEAVGALYVRCNGCNSLLSVVLSLESQAPAISLFAWHRHKLLCQELQ